MGKAPTPDTITADLTVPERVLLFCLASGPIGKGWTSAITIRVRAVSR
jgi:hypothetical protein